MAKRRDHVHNDFYAPFWERKKLNNMPQNEENNLQMLYERVLSELAMNRFKWEGFPESVDTRFLEMQLHFNGLAVAFKDTGTTERAGTDRIFVLRATPSGQRNIMDNPTAFTLSGPGLQSRFQGVQLSIRNCVPIWPNYTRMTDADIITTYARKLAKVDRTIEINLDSARRTKVLVYDENTRLSAENIERQINSGAPAIRVKQDIGTMIQAMDLGVDPKSIETLSVVRARLWSEAMGLLGINNANQDKKERLVESEVDSNTDQVANMRRVNLNARQDACVAMRRMFPDDLPNVWVDYHTELQPVTQPGLPGVEGDGLYDGDVQHVREGQDA